MRWTAKKLVGAQLGSMQLNRRAAAAAAAAEEIEIGATKAFLYSIFLSNSVRI